MPRYANRLANDCCGDRETVIAGGSLFGKIYKFQQWSLLATIPSSPSLLQLLLLLRYMLQENRVLSTSSTCKPLTFCVYMCVYNCNTLHLLACSSRVIFTSRYILIQQAQNIHPDYRRLLLFSVSCRQLVLT